MWHNLANIAYENQNFLITARCYAAMGNVARSKYLQKLATLSKENSEDYGDGNSPEVMAKLSLLNGNLNMAENIYVEHGELENAIEMFKKIHKWDFTLRSSIFTH